MKIEEQLKPTVDYNKRFTVGLLLLYKEKSEGNENMKNYKIAVAGTGARDIIGATKKTYDN